VISKLSQPQALFDPVRFLNDILPSPNLSSQSAASKIDRGSQIQNVSVEVLSLLSTLNNHNIRCSSELNALTDEIVRSGNRLAYEVEILRGDVNGLHELLTETLREDIQQFVLDELTEGGSGGEPVKDGVDLEESTPEKPATDLKTEPEFITQLRLLGQVKGRLESVITVFGEALKWPLPPSELSVTSSLISVSSPELGLQNSAEDDKAREIGRALRAEIADLLESDGGGYTGLEAAVKRVDEFRQLATVWKGTGEERARTKFIDSLAKIAEDRRKALETRTGPSKATTAADGSPSSSSTPSRRVKVGSDGGPAGGLFRNLQRLKDDLYLE